MLADRATCITFLFFRNSSFNSKQCYAIICQQGCGFCFFWVFKLINLFIFWLRWVFVAARGFSSSCGEQGLLFVAVRGLLIAVASLHCRARALGTRASVVVAHGL